MKFATTICATAFCFFASNTHAKCDDVGRLAAAIALAHLKEEGLTNNDKIDFKKTQWKQLAVQHLDAPEAVGEDEYRYVHDIVFSEKHGATIEVITTSVATQRESCAMSDTDVYVVSKRFRIEE
ncbi:hypothetical protein [Burkholderia ambifaria]|jgi:hypothetical protein|uniref:hypothetical protein n=1 Tax=Burkholderia ambifaria TaxID=152480 RepID=UPI001B9CCD35|nr:hypothetical protein [Burkholderia ambifaria]MBR8225963.1 hypothetical protein [Burkholderia ambifaria]